MLVSEMLNELVDPQFHASGRAHEVWSWMRDHAPVHLHPSSAYPAFWSLTRYADVRSAYSDPESFSSASGVLLRPIKNGADPGSGLTLALTDPPRHKQLRSLLSSQFTRRSVRDLEVALSLDVRSALMRAVQRGRCDFAHDIASRLSTLAMCHLVGIAPNDEAKFLGWVTEAFSAGKPLTGHGPLVSYLMDLICSRMQGPGDDLVGRLTNPEACFTTLTEKEVLLNVENLIGASENAGLSMASGMHALLENPTQWQRLVRDRSLLGTAVDEILRWSSSATHSMRTATRPVTIGGQHISTGERLVLWVPSANRDSNIFEDPYCFDIGRRPNRHLALGFGEHVCIGGVLARTQLTLLLTEMLDVVGKIELDGPVVLTRSIAVSGPEHLPVRIVGR